MTLETRGPGLLEERPFRFEAVEVDDDDDGDDGVREGDAGVRDGDVREDVDVDDVDEGDGLAAERIKKDGVVNAYIFDEDREKQRMC